MALSIGELIGYLRIDDSGVAEGLSRSEQRLQGFKGAAGAIGGAAGGAAGAALASAMGSAISFDSANAKLSAQMGLTAAQSEQAGALAGQLYGNGMGDSIETVNGAIQGVAQNMGVAVDSVDMAPLTNQALVLSDVFGIDVAESTRAAGNMMRNLGMDGSAALDAVGGITEKYGVRAEDLLDTLEEYPVQFEKLGLTGEQSFGILDQALEGNARNTDIAADALKEFSIRSVDGSEAAAKSFEALGLNAEEMTATFARGGPEASAALDTVFDRLRATEGQAGAAEIAFGLFGTQSEDLGRALYTIDPSEAGARVEAFTGTLDEAGAKMADTAESKVETARRGFEMFTAGLIQTEGPLGLVAAATAAYGPAAIGMAGSLAMVGMAIGPLLVQLGALVVSAAKTAAGWALSLLSMAANAALAVGRILISLTLWVAQTIAQGAIAVARMAATAVLYVAQWILMGVQAMARAAMMAAAWLVAMGPVGWVIAAVIGLVALIIANWDTVVAWTTQAWSAVTQFISDAWNNITSWVSGAVANVVAWITGAWNNISGATSAAWQAVLGFITGAWNNITNFVSGAITNVVNFIRGAWDNATRLASDAWNNIVNAVRNGANNVLNFVRGLPGQILGALGNLGSLLFNAGRDIVTGLWNGIVGMGSWLWNKIMGWIRNVVPGPILQFLGIASPSKFMRDEIGRWIPEGLADGIIGNAQIAGQAARDMAELVAREAQPRIIAPALDDLGRAAQEILGQMARGGAVFEDLTFRGASANVGRYNDDLIDQARARGMNRTPDDMKRFLTDLVASQQQRPPTTITVNNPLPETTSYSITRRASTLEALGAFG